MSLYGLGTRFSNATFVIFLKIHKVLKDTMKIIAVFGRNFLADLPNANK